MSSLHEYRLIPRIALDYENYEMVDPDLLATKLGEGWTPIAVFSWTTDSGHSKTRFICGKDFKEKPSLPYEDPAKAPELRLPPLVE